MSLDVLTTKEKQERAYELALSALLGEGEFFLRRAHQLGQNAHVKCIKRIVQLWKIGKFLLMQTCNII